MLFFSEFIQFTRNHCSQVLILNKQVHPVGKMTGVSSQTSAAICVACFLQTALQTILVRYASKHLAFSHSFTTWMIEVTKLCLASLVWFLQGRGTIHWRLGWVSVRVCMWKNVCESGCVLIPGDRVKFVTSQGRIQDFSAPDATPILIRNSVKSA